MAERLHAVAYTICKSIGCRQPVRLAMVTNFGKSMKFPVDVTDGGHGFQEAA